MAMKQRAQRPTWMEDGDTIVVASIGTGPIVTATAIRTFYPAPIKTTTVMEAKTVRRALALALGMWSVVLAAWLFVTQLG